jgi:arginase
MLPRMPVSFIVVPQWQGSGSPRRRELADGAAAIRAALPGSAVRDVEVPDDPGEAQDGVHGYSVLHQICRHHARVRAETHGAAITIGGDCGVDLAAVADTARRAPGDLAVVWFDAHCDLNSPAVSPSGRFHGMVLRAVVGEGAPGLVADPAAAVPPERVVLAGTRVFDTAERDYIAARGMQVLSPVQLTPEAVVAAVAATGASSVFLHVDVDILDPGELRGICYPVPDGVSVATLVASIAALRAGFRFAGGGLTEFAPRSPAEAAHDLPIVQRILGALAG